MKPLTEVHEIAQIAYGFMGSKALFASLNNGLFECLADESKSLSEISAETNHLENLIETLAIACVSLGLLEFDGSTYKNAPATRRYLLRSSKAFFGDYYRFQIDRQVYPNLAGLDSALRGDEVAGLYTGGFSDLSRAVDFTRGQHAGSLGPAFVLARSVDLSGVETLLDVGGGSGAFCIMLCKRFPQLKATIADFPNVLDVARYFVEESDLADRIDFISAEDGFNGWPEQADAVLMSYLCSAIGRSATKDFVSHSLDTLSPNGRLFIHDFMVDDDHQGPSMAACWSLAMTMGNPDSTVIRPAMIEALLEEIGFTDIRIKPLIAGITSLVEACRP
ncbi:methyltransferase [Ruegeria sp. SCP11]|uniref:methyltransferase n=1 Tax=Ruegeria sp. SCP11 TaxID=3141378 RepID=UPI00333CE931